MAFEQAFVQPSPTAEVATRQFADSTSLVRSLVTDFASNSAEPEELELTVSLLAVRKETVELPVVV